MHKFCPNTDLNDDWIRNVPYYSGQKQGAFTMAIQGWPEFMMTSGRG